ncbi:MAG: HoxN/HupN/NixA family nickel/cobalt transporter [Chloroflexi bacterium]|nr:HoxN/HupN/NixA family nickel/cobalt transporter [Chloroflexota bacterium]
MATLVQTLQQHFDRGERQRLAAVYGIILMLHLVGFGVLFLIVAPHYPVMLGLGGLAYTFGLRHAFDADHISAIDNTTRKLLQDRQRPVAVGFFFSLGHSSVVFFITLGLALAVRYLVDGVQGDALKTAGSVIGTSVSGIFLLLIGVLNLLILIDVIRSYRQMKSGRSDASVADQLVAGGLMTRLFGKLFGLIHSSWQMYVVGFLFGLGFDTASEVALLAISASAASQHLPLISVLCLPIIFASGMALMDTTDGAFMAKAYSWAFSHPLRKVIYNLTVTSLSVFVALFIGVVELLQVLSSQLNWSGTFWTLVKALNFNVMGFIIVLAFICAWIVAMLLWKAQRVEHVQFAGLDD